MALMEITEFPERVLKEVGEPVEKFDGDLERLVAGMFGKSCAGGGAGLAAPLRGAQARRRQPGDSVGRGRAGGRGGVSFGREDSRATQARRARAAARTGRA